MQLELKVFILLLNYIKWQDTLECVKSLRHCLYSNFEIFIVDNASPNESEIMLRKYLSDIQIFQTGTNLGYTGGINFGIKKILNDNPSYILILNPDTLVDPDFLQVMVESMEENPSAAASCCTIYYYPNVNRIWYAGGIMIPWRGLAIHNRALPTLNGKLNESPQSVSFITGCMVLIRTSTIRKIGLQDERFFMYLDDMGPQQGY